MARVLDREKAIALRLQGKTYSEIRRTLNVPKSTLSYWLSKYPLTVKQIQLIQQQVRHNKDLAIEKYRATRLLKRETRLQNAYIDQKQNLLPLTKKELEIAGLFLYWGEGNKSMKGPISVSNTNPEVIVFSMYWLLIGLEIPKTKIKVLLHLYSDMSKEEEIEYWSNVLRIPRSQFCKPYIKASTRENITQKGFGHGTCTLVVSDILLKEKVMMSIKAIADEYCSNVV